MKRSRIRRSLSLGIKAGLKLLEKVSAKFGDLRFGYYLAISFLTLFQVLDGLFTYLGVVIVGTTAIEGNPLVKYLMDSMGVAEGLILAKGLGVLLCLFMLRLGNFRGNLRLARLSNLLVYLVTFIYFVVLAVWAYTLVQLVS